MRAMERAKLLKLRVKELEKILNRIQKDLLLYETYQTNLKEDTK